MQATEEKKIYPVVLSIAGSDSGGGAGIQADLKTFSALGTFGATAITALTAQNTMGVKAIYSVSPEFLEQQIRLVFEDLKPVSVKIGMLHTAEVVDVVARCLEEYAPQAIVLDPVMIATSGDLLILRDTVDAIKAKLIPLSTIITPNLDEAEILLEQKIETLEDMKRVAPELLTLGCKSVLLKGGHLKGEKMYDIFQDKSKQSILVSDFIPTVNTHGTGCTLSSAISAYLAKNYSLQEAVELAKVYITQAIDAGKDVSVGYGHGPVNHFFNPQKLNPVLL